MTRFIAYYRVSTDKQGKSGLGLDAQRQAVGGFVAGRGEIIAEHTEIESTRNKRPEMQAALDMCNLMESRVDFVAVDMPEANRLTIHILAAVAEHDREMISQRTRDALQAAKARGVVLGNPHPWAASRQALAALRRRTGEFHATVRPLIHTLRQQGYSLPAIARELNDRSIPTARGGLWYATTVRNILRRPL